MEKSSVIDDLLYFLWKAKLKKKKKKKKKNEPPKYDLLEQVNASTKR